MAWTGLLLEVRPVQQSSLYSITGGGETTNLNSLAGFVKTEVLHNKTERLKREVLILEDRQHNIVELKSVSMGVRC